MKKHFDPTLCLVTDAASCGGRKVEDVVAAAIPGGVTMVQLRDKNLPDPEFVAFARRLIALSARK
ncbi:MAG: thiamine phosphate synthase [Planctomycetota bacterium]